MQRAVVSLTDIIARTPVVILCGGRGSRLGRITDDLPKPLVPVGGPPMVRHVIDLYRAAGYRDFILLTGYKGSVFDQVNLGPDVERVPTGEDSETGCRLSQVRDRIRSDNFALTYGDGLCDVDLQENLEYHYRHGRAVTVTAVRAPSRFGHIEFERVLPGTARECLEVTRFDEKPVAGWINGGFMVVQTGVLWSFDGTRGCSFEKDVMPKLARNTDMAALAHEGFWQCMDTPRDLDLLEELSHDDPPPWVRNYGDDGPMEFDGVIDVA